MVRFNTGDMVLAPCWQALSSKACPARTRMGYLGFERPGPWEPRHSTCVGSQRGAIQLVWTRDLLPSCSFSPPRAGRT